MTIADGVRLTTRADKIQILSKVGETNKTIEKKTSAVASLLAM